MEKNTSGRKKHLVDGTVDTITRGAEVAGEAVEEVKESLGKAVENVSEAINGAGRKSVTRKKKGFFARLLDSFKK